MTPEDIARLDLDNTARAHKAEFMEQCLASRMSQRQVQVFEDCLADTTCAPLIDCLDQANPLR